MFLLRIGGARFAGLAAGALLVGVLAVTTWRVPPSRAPLGLDVALRAAPSGELEVQAPGDILSSPALVAGGPPASGIVHVRNQTGRTVDALPFLRGGDAGVEQAMHLLVTRRGHTLYSGPAAGFRARRAKPVRIGAGGQAALRVRAWVPRPLGTALTGRGGRWDLVFSVEAA